MAHTSPDGHDSTTVNDCASRIDEQFDPLGTYTQDVTWSEMKVGTLEFPTYRISTDGDWGGLEIEGGFKLDEGRSINDAPCCCDEVRWIQLISTNKLPGAAVTPGVDHYLDPLNDRDPAKDPFYWGTEDSEIQTPAIIQNDTLRITTIDNSEIIIPLNDFGLDKKRLTPDRYKYLLKLKTKREVTVKKRGLPEKFLLPLFESLKSGACQ